MRETALWISLDKKKMSMRYVEIIMYTSRVLLLLLIILLLLLLNRKFGPSHVRSCVEHAVSLLREVWCDNGMFG